MPGENNHHKLSLVLNSRFYDLLLEGLDAGHIHIDCDAEVAHLLSAAKSMFVVKNFGGSVALDIDVAPLQELEVA